MLIHTRNEHPNMQANKLSTKYHLHVQHSTNTKIQSDCIKDIKSNKGTRVMCIKKCITLTTSTKLQSMGAKQNIEYKLKYINQSTKSFKQKAQYKHL